MNTTSTAIDAEADVPPSASVALTVRPGRAYRGDEAVQAMVLDASWRQGLVAVRALHRAGVNAGAIDCVPEAAVFSSRMCSVCALVPDFTHAPKRYVDALIEVLRRYSRPVVIPTTDGSIEALRARRAEVERYAHLALGNESALAAAVSKARTLAVAAELGIAVPLSIPVTTTANIPAAMREIGYPAVLKPLQSWVEKNGAGTRLICEAVMSDDEAKRKADSIFELGGSVVAQQWLPGARESVNLMYAQGTVWAKFAQVAQRMLPPLGGSSVMRESIPLPIDATQDAERLIRAIDLEGYSEIEFRRDADGRPVLMEINPRLSGSVEIAVRAGVNFPHLVYAWGKGEPLWHVGGYRTGIRVRWLGGDIRYLKETFATQGRPDVEPLGRATRTFVFDFLRPAAYDYIDRGDMRPAAQATWQTLRRPLQRALRRVWA